MISVNLMRLASINSVMILALILLIISEPSAMVLARDSTVLTTNARVLNDANLSSLKIKGNDEDRNSFFFKTGRNICTIKIKNGELQFATDSMPFLSVNQVQVESSKNTLFNQGLEVTGEIEIDGKRQWGLAYRMDYRDYEPSIIYQCGIYKLIGGYKKTSIDEMTKSFPLPPHTMVKIEGHFHFIDNWKGETGFVKVILNKKDSQVLFTESADIRGITNGIDTCGGATVDPLIARKFDVAVMHDEPTLDLVFGSTLTCDPGYASYGISDLEIYIL
jgi:hypothetical protein